ncbi:DUF2971 domain-containing protein [Burkholderia ubonensis]|nr:hypothetical protein CJO68_29935 [Burkholderia ubonensis]PAK08148.1 hypothetical protein CJO67_09330 [Burkholderia ubonensis]RQP69505.1 DUF2971 domain-containing protein [Burkholderia ubonensis]RQP80351.1 DUF2971 domain-containing protein [Burkholderia ubonensis]RQP99585.1 DUF2971 domain-containing protein [Burkholderia ubonensis]
MEEAASSRSVCLDARVQSRESVRSSIGSPRGKRMELINAETDRHQLLYHYQPFSGRHIAYLEQTLRDRTVHLSKPSSFNDPWDSKPWFNSSILDDPQERDRHLDWLLTTTGVPADAPPAEEMRGNPALLRAVIEQVRDGHIRAIDDQYRLYCLTPNPLHQLMWAHYGDNHRGVCLEFDARADLLIGAYRVHYTDTLPVQRVYTDEENASLVPIFTKSDVWAYEHEYRLVAEERQQARPHMPNTIESNLHLPRNGTLVGLVIGCQCDEDHVRDLCDRHGRDLRLRRAVRVQDRYEIRLEQIR